MVAEQHERFGLERLHRHAPIAVECRVAGEVGRVDLDGLEVRVPVEAEQPDRLLGAVVEDQRDRVGAGRADRERRVDRAGQLAEARVLHETQHLDELAGAVEPRSASSRRRSSRNPTGRSQSLQGPGEVERARLALQQRQVVARVVGRLLRAPVPRSGTRRARCRS